MKYYLISTSIEELNRKGWIFDENNKRVRSIPKLFGYGGNYSFFARQLFEQYKITGEVMGDKQDHFLCKDKTCKGALAEHLNRLQIRKEINEFLTPEVEEKLLALFTKK